MDSCQLPKIFLVSGLNLSITGTKHNWYLVTGTKHNAKSSGWRLTKREHLFKCWDSFCSVFIWDILCTASWSTPNFTQQSRRNFLRSLVLIWFWSHYRSRGYGFTTWMLQICYCNQLTYRFSTLARFFHLQFQQRVAIEQSAASYVIGLSLVRCEDDRLEHSYMCLRTRRYKKNIAPVNYRR